MLEYCFYIINRTFNIHFSINLLQQMLLSGQHFGRHLIADFNRINVFWTGPSGIDKKT